MNDSGGFSAGKSSSILQPSVFSIHRLLKGEGLWPAQAFAGDADLQRPADTAMRRL
jgi:hypothetical protein